MDFKGFLSVWQVLVVGFAHVVRAYRISIAERFIHIHQITGVIGGVWFDGRYNGNLWDSIHPSHHMLREPGPGRYLLFVGIDL